MGRGGGSGWFCCGGEGQVSATLVPTGMRRGGAGARGAARRLPHAHTPTGSLRAHPGGQAGPHSFQKASSGSPQPWEGGLEKVAWM